MLRPSIKDTLNDNHFNLDLVFPISGIPDPQLLSVSIERG